MDQPSDFPRFRENTRPLVWRPDDHKVISSLSKPDYTRWLQDIIPGAYNTSNTLDRGSWWDTYVHWYCTWDRYNNLPGGNAWHVRGVNLWDLGRKYIVAIAMDAANLYSPSKGCKPIPEVEYRRVIRVLWRYFKMDRDAVTGLLRQAKRHWKNSQSDLSKVHQTYLGAKNGSVGHFHVNMANYRLDEVQAEYRLTYVPRTSVAFITPVGLDYLVNHQGFSRSDPFTPVFQAQRSATTTKLLWWGPCKRGHARDYAPNVSIMQDHVLYFEVT
jgi:hypothetical protein